MRSTLVGLTGALLLLVAVVTGGAGLFLLNQALGYLPTSTFVFDLEIGVAGFRMPLSNHTACALLLFFSGLIGIAGLGMMGFASVRAMVTWRAPAAASKRESTDQNEV